MSSPHEEIKLAVAEDLARNEEIRNYCIEHFKATPLVIVNRYGAEGFPGEDEAPFIFIYSDGENESGDVDEETFDFCIVFGAVDPSKSPRTKVLMKRTADSSGLVVSGMAAEVEHVREMILRMVEESVHGAIFRSAARTESNMSDYPLEWAKLRVSYAEPDTLDS
jgi:hypothetical protein